MSFLHVRSCSLRLIACIGCLLLILLSTLSAVTASPHSSILWIQTENPSASLDEVIDVAIDGSGVYLVGYEISNSKWRIQKRNLVEGSIIWTQTSNPSVGEDKPNDVAVDSSGLYVVGYDSDTPSSGNPQWRIEKRKLTDGSVIWVKTNSSTHNIFGPDKIYKIATDSSGIYITGIFNDAIRIEKRNHMDGSIIWIMPGDATIDFGPSGMTIDSSGLYLVGSGGGGYNAQWRIQKRHLTNGSLIWDQTSNPTAYNDEPFGVTVDSSGLYVVGYDAGNYWRIEKRNPDNGSLTWAQTGNPTAQNIITGGAYTVASDATGIYIAGDTPTPSGSREWRLEKRALIDGSVNWNETSNLGPHYGSAIGIVTDSSGIYVVGSDISGNDGQWRIEKRNLDSTTAPIRSFRVTFNIMNGTGQIRFNDTIYNNGDTISTNPGTHIINGITAIDNQFIRWETSGSMCIFDSNYPDTTCTISGNATLKMILESPTTPTTTTTTDTTTTDTAAETTTETTTETTNATATDTTTHTATTTDTTTADTTTDTATTTGTTTTGTITSTETTNTLTTSPSTTPLPTALQPCIIATASYGSPMASEVVFMRYVRDNMIGSTDIGKILVSGWNIFYYSWSPSVATMIVRSETLQYTFRIMLLPLVAIIHSTAFIYSTLAPLSMTAASILGFLYAAISSVAVYIVVPTLALQAFYEKRTQILKRKGRVGSQI